MSIIQRRQSIINQKTGYYFCAVCTILYGLVRWLHKIHRRYWCRCGAIISLTGWAVTGPMDESCCGGLEVEARQFLTRVACSLVKHLTLIIRLPTKGGFQCGYLYRKNRLWVEMLMRTKLVCELRVRQCEPPKTDEVSYPYLQMYPSLCTWCDSV